VQIRGKNRRAYSNLSKKSTTGAGITTLKTKTEGKKSMEGKCEDEADRAKELMGSTKLLGENHGTKYHRELNLAYGTQPHVF